MIELSIPQINEESKNVKDMVFTILTSEQPLSTMELTNRIKKQYALNITYQGVRKAVDSLNKQNVLTKKGKKYAINKEWILKTKSFFDKLLTTYEVGKQLKTFTNELAKENYAIYTFNNLLDLDNFWGDLQIYWADHKGKEYFAYCNYNWWFLINLGHETKTFEYFNKKNINSKFIIAKDVKLNHWAGKIYSELGVKTKVIDQKEKGEIVDINILDDTIIQVNYSNNIVLKIKNLFEKYKSLQEINIRDITKLAYEPCEIKFAVFKNPIISKNFRDTYEKIIDK